MKTKLLPVLSFAVAVSLFGTARADDEVKKTDKPEAKKDEGCPCCPSDKKKDETTRKDDAAPASAPSGVEKTGCADCAKAKEGCCDACKTKLENGLAFVVPIKMTKECCEPGTGCPECEKQVADAIKGVDGVTWAVASNAKKAAIFAVAPGKSVKLSAIQAALKSAPVAVDETAPLRGRVTLSVGGVDCGCCVMDIAVSLSKLKGVGSVTDRTVDWDTKTGSFTICLGAKSEVSLKSLRDAVAAVGGQFKLTDLSMTAPKEATKNDAAPSPAETKSEAD